MFSAASPLPAPKITPRSLSWHGSCYSIDPALTIDSINGTKVGTDIAWGSM